MKNTDIPKVIKVLKEEIKRWQQPIVTEVSNRTKSPFQVLISCILSQRTKDSTTAGASYRLFKLASTPKEMCRLNVKDIETAIYPVGFYRTKAKNIKSICRDLIEKYNSIVPDEIDELLKLKGVGRKTANLVVTLGYNKYGICVDTHVHRITNRWGYVKTRAPEETEFALRKRLPKRYWRILNDLLVTYGQNLCRPLSPYCSQCRIYRYCKRAGVEKIR